MTSSSTGGHRIKKAFEASKSRKKMKMSHEPMSAKGRMGKLIKRNTSPKSVNPPPPNRQSKGIFKMTTKDWSTNAAYSGKAWDAREMMEIHRQRRSSHPTHGMRKR